MHLDTLAVSLPAIANEVRGRARAVIPGSDSRPVDVDVVDLVLLGERNQGTAAGHEPVSAQPEGQELS